MKNFLLKIGVLSLLINFNTIFAQDLNMAFNSFISAYNSDQITGMESAAKEILKIDPDHYAGYAFSGYVSLLKNDLQSASKYLQTASNINPVDASSYGISAYLHFLKGNIPLAKKLMYYSFQIKTAGLEATTLGDVAQLERFLKIDLSALKTMIRNANIATQGAEANTQKYLSSQQEWLSGKSPYSEKTITDFFNRQQFKNPMPIALIKLYKGIGFFNKQKYKEAEEAFNTFVKDTQITNNTDKAYNQALAYYYLTLCDNLNANKHYLNATNGLKKLQDIPFTTKLKCNLLQQKSIAEGNLGEKEAQLSTAHMLLSESKKIAFSFMVAQASNTIGGYYVMSPLVTNRQKAANYLSNAYQIATDIGDKQLLNQIATNYAISLWQQGKKQEAISVSNTSYNFAVESKDYTGAQLASNNIGFMSFMEKDYINASKLFRKAIDITEKYRKKLPAQEQLAIMNEHTSAYGGLIMSLQKTNNISELFEVQDLNRSRLLRDKLDKKAKSKSLKETQQLLKADEVLLYYSEAGPGEMIVSVVTNTNAKVAYNFPIEKWLRLKRKYVNRTTQQPNSINGYVTKINQEIINGQIVTYQNEKQGFKSKDYEKFIRITRDLLNTTDAKLIPVQQELLRFWYDYLIAPVKPLLSEKTKLIISSEGSLNYLPFEAFMNTNGKYLVEDYNIKYIPSVTSWASLQNRNFRDDRKSLLAMGGATYQTPSKNKGNVRSATSLFQIKDNITTKINKKSNNISKELQTLGFGGANYLPGTLKEVQNLKKIVPNGTVLINEEMKESDLKRLNESGNLANYKWIHIATHGFAMDNIPELSGVMMTQPNGGDGNEDTFLLAHEIANLNLNADLAVLSACETALGKVYGGEGINGLNSALLSAGANNTLLSLWPVNDAGTMIMMTVLYDYLYRQKFSVEDAVNSTKRDILNGKYGEQFKNPSIWAPFVLNGK